MKVVTVIPLVQGAYKEDLTYFTARDVLPGTIVSVPIRKSTVDAVVVSAEHLTSSKIAVKESAFALKKINAIKGPIPFYKEFWNAVIDAKTYFLSTSGAALYAIVPKIFFDEHEALPAPAPRAIETNAELAGEKIVLARPLDERIALYKTLIRESFARKQSIFITLPTVRDAAYFYNELKKGVEEYIYLFHSDVSPKETLKRYSTLLGENHPIVIIGTPSYLCIPRHDLATIIVEREASSAYRQVVRPSIDMRIFAEFYARRIGAKLILADTFLRAETVYRTENGSLSEMSHFSYHLSKKVSRQIIDVRRAADTNGDKKKFQILSDQLRSAIAENTALGGRTFIFTLRKGLAPITQCGDCESVLLCDRCQSPLVLYKETAEKRIYACNRCEKKFPSLMLCPTCSSWKLVPLGIGTESVEDEAKRLFPAQKIFILDKERAKTPKQAEKIIKEFYEHPGSILIGTEIALPYLRDPIPTVAIASFDSLFSVPSFRISEKIISLVGRLEEIAEERLLIQTKNADEALIRDISSGNLAAWYKAELSVRESLGFPPFASFVKLSFSGKESDGVGVRRMAESLFADMQAEYFPPVAHRHARGVTTHLIIKLPKESWVPETVIKKSDTAQAFASRAASLGREWSITVDPDDLV